MRFELQIELNGIKYALDTYNEEPISLTYNISDIADISSKNSSFSKTIKLPETRNNRAIFGDISDLGVSPTQFNPNKKTKAWILVDTAVVFEGYLQLRKVFINKETGQGDLEVVIYAETDNFYKQLGDGMITDMSFTELDHEWNKTNITSSWTASYTNGYYYPLIDYGQDWDLGEINGWTSSYNTEVKIANIFPATSVKYIWDKIFSYANYNYQSTFLNSDVFKNLYIPFNKAKLTRDIETTAGRFTVGLTFSMPLKGTVENTSAFVQYTTNYGPQGGGAVQVANARPFNMGTWRVPFNNETSPLGDPNNLYNWNLYAPQNTTYYYQAPAVGQISQQFVCEFDITLPFTIPLDAYRRPGNSPQQVNSFTTVPLAYICFKRSRNPITGATVSGGYIIKNGANNYVSRFIASEIPGLITTNTTTTWGALTSNSVRVKGTLSTPILNSANNDALRKLYPGEQVWVEVGYAVPASALRTNNGLVDLSASIWQMLVGTPQIIFNNCLFYNQVSPDVLPNEFIDYNSALPANIKKKDFVSSIIKMFNLYIEPSKERANTLIIEPRDEYYQGGVIKDWTEKLDTNTPIEEMILGETQNKKTIFKYKDDKDFYNENYTTTTGGLGYGEYDYYIDNDFITGEKKIELIFSPTPIVSVKLPNSNDYSKIIIPKIVKAQQDQPQDFCDHNVRILTRFASSTKSSWVYGDFQFNSTNGYYNAYVKLTSTGFGNASHTFNVGDYVRVAQADGGASKPMLQGYFKVVEIVNIKTIVIDIPFYQVGSGAAIGGVVYPVDGMLPTDDTSIWSFEGTKFKAYPYLGHLNNPLAPTYDINFGQTLGLYFPNTITTNDNLFEVYWSNFINELSDRDSRIITANFYLNPFDIADFKFNDNIFIRDQYFKVNKIQNYDPTREALVKIELIKTEYITVPRKINTVFNTNPKNIGLSANIQLKPITSGAVLATSGNFPAGNGSILVGRNNTAGGNSIAVGINNNVNNGSISVGVNNTIENNSSMAVGNNNQLLNNADLATKFVFGSDNTHLGTGLIIGDNNFAGTMSKSTYLFGTGNTILQPQEASIERAFIIGNYNVITSTFTQSVTDVFIQGLSSSVRASGVALFGNNTIAGTNSTNSHIIGDNITYNLPDTLYVSKPRTNIISTNVDISGGSLNVASRASFTAGATFSGGTVVIEEASFTDATFAGNATFSGGTVTVGSTAVFSGGISFSSTIDLGNAVTVKDTSGATIDLNSAADTFSYVTATRIRIPDTVNVTEPTAGVSSFIKIVDLPQTNAGDWTGEAIEGIGDNAVTSGQVGYLDGLGKWLIASADDIGALERGNQLGVILHSASASETTTILLRGFYSPGDYLQPQVGMQIGQPLYIASSAGPGYGFITNLPPSNPGDVVRIIGYLHNETSPYTVRFSPSDTWIEL